MVKIKTLLNTFNVSYLVIGGGGAGGGNYRAGGGGAQLYLQTGIMKIRVVDKHQVLHLL